MALFESLGLGVRMTLDNEVSNRVDPIINDLNRLRQASTSATQQMNANNQLLGQSFNQYLNAQRIRDMNTAMRGTGAVLNDVTDRLVRATTAMHGFNNAQSYGQMNAYWSQMQSNVLRTQRQLSELSGVMSRMQERQMDNRAYQWLNYDLKEVQDRIKLTEQAINRLNRAPDSAHTRRELELARRALAEYQRQLGAANQTQVYAQNAGYRTMRVFGQESFIRPIRGFDQLTARMRGFMSLDMAFAANSAYQSINRLTQAIIGNGYTAMETKKKQTQLATSMQTMGTMLTTFVTPALLVAQGALVAYAKAFEGANNVFQARTLMPLNSMVGMGGYEDEMQDTQIRTGAKFDEVAKTMAWTRNTFTGATANHVQQLTTYGLQFAKVWGIDAVKAITGFTALQDKLGVNGTQALDIYTLSLKATNGDTEKAAEYAMKHAGALREQTSATKDGSQAFESMNKAMDRGAIATWGGALRQVGGAMREIWEGVDGSVAAVGRGLGAFGKVLTDVLRQVPVLATIGGHMLVFSTALLTILGPLLVATGLMIQFKSVIQGVSASIFGLARGGLAVLSPAAVMAFERMNMLKNVIGRLPQILLGIIPLAFTFARGLGIMAFQIMRMNPLMTTFTALFIAYNNNFAGFKDKVDAGIASITQGWNRLEDMYVNSPLPKVFQSLAEHARAFGEGVAEGFTFVYDIGKSLLDTVMIPLQNSFQSVKPFVADLYNAVDTSLGGKGGANADNVVDKIVGSTAQWKEVGVVVGKVLAGFTAFLLLARGLDVVLRPFRRLASTLGTIGQRLGGVGRQMAGMGRQGLSNVYHTPGRIGQFVNAPLPGARLIPGTQSIVGGGTLQGAHPNAPMIPMSRAQILQHNYNTARTLVTNAASTAGGAMLPWITAPLASLRNALSPLSYTNVMDRIGRGMGIYAGVQGTRRRAELSRAGMRVTGADIARYGLRTAMDPLQQAAVASSMTATGRMNGQSVFRAQQGFMSRLLTGQRFVQFIPQYNAAGQLTGHRQETVRRTGGFLNRQDDNLAPRNLVRSGFNAARAGVGAVGNFAGSMASTAFGPLSASYLAARGALGAVSSSIGGRYDAGLNRLRTSAMGRAAGRLTGWTANRLTRAGINNPYAGMFAPATNAAGAPVGRFRQAATVAGRGLMGTGSMLASSAMMAGAGAARVGRGAYRGGRMVARGVAGTARGIGAVGRGVGRAATSPLRMLSRGAGALAALAFNPLTLAAGLVGYGAWNAFAGGKDGKKSVNNIAGNMDKATANIGQGGGKAITDFWNNFLKTAKPIVAASGRLIAASFKALISAMPAIWSSVKKGFSALWKWASTDGVKLLGQFWKWLSGTAAPAAGKAIQKALGAAWNWVKTDGMKLLGQFFSWLWNTAIPKAYNKIKEWLGKAWNWVKTDGMKLLGQFFSWLWNEAIPKAYGKIKEWLGKAWDWVKTDGMKLFGELMAWVVGTMLPNIYDTVVKWIGDAWNWAKDDGLKLFGDVLSYVINDFIPNLAKELASGIGAAFSGAIEGAKNAWAGFVGGLEQPKPSGSVGKSGAKGSTSKRPPSSKPPHGKKYKEHAMGGFMNTPHLGLVGEAGPEVIIPLSGNMRTRGESLFRRTAEIMGYDVKKNSPAPQEISVKAYAQGGVTAPVRDKSRGGSGAVDARVSIDRIDVHLPPQAGGAPGDMRKQAEVFLKEVRKILKEEGLRSGQTIDLHDLVKNYA